MPIRLRYHVGRFQPSRKICAILIECPGILNRKLPRISVNERFTLVNQGLVMILPSDAIFRGVAKGCKLTKPLVVNPDVPRIHR